MKTVYTDIQKVLVQTYRNKVLQQAVDTDIQNSLSYKYRNTESLSSVNTEIQKLWLARYRNTAIRFLSDTEIQPKLYCLGFFLGFLYRNTALCISNLFCFSFI